MEIEQCHQVECIRTETALCALIRLRALDHRIQSRGNAERFKYLGDILSEIAALCGCLLEVFQQHNRILKIHAAIAGNIARTVQGKPRTHDGENEAYTQGMF